jgi:hypothetical protein
MKDSFTSVYYWYLFCAQRADAIAEEALKQEFLCVEFLTDITLVRK